MDFSNRPLTPTSNRILPPVVLTALLWVGVQSLVLLYLRTSLGSLLVRAPQVAEELRRALIVGSSHGLSTRGWIWLTNLAFVVLLWFQLRASRPLTAPRDRYLALVVYGGTALLLLLTNSAWSRILLVP
jgi:hypothetical protein